MSDDDLAQLREELMVQEIMLDSLEDVSDGADDEDRRVIEEDIARLRRLIAKAERGEPAIEDIGATSAETAEAASSGSQNARPRTNRSPSSSPSTPRRSSQGQRPPNNISHQTGTPQHRTTHAQPGSTPLSVRKRERRDTNGIEQNEGQSKSRRTTPPSDDYAFGSSTDRSNHSDRSGFDIIDLTGDDDYNASAIANNIREKERRRHAVASPSRRYGESSASQGQNSAFDRIMQTQRLNSGPLRFDDGRQDHRVPSHLPNGGAHHTEDPLSRMPGTYDPSWDTQSQPLSFGSRPVPPALFNPSLSQYQPRFGQVSGPQVHSPYHEQMRARTGETFPGPTNPPFGGFPASSMSAGLHGPSSVQGAAAPWTGQIMPGGFASVAQRIMGDRSSLSAIIDQTRDYDFGYGVDGSGNALPDRVQNFWDQMRDPEVTEKELEDLLKNIRPDMDIQDENRVKTPPGLSTDLYLHQELALSWLKKMEEGTNKGGILADDMGLGKTISMISLMTIRPASSRPKTNLIVAPVALLRQWEEEIKTKLKTSHSMSTFIYRNRKTTTEELLRYDVVITTYGTLAAELKRLEKIKAEARTVDLNDKMYATKIPLLHPYKAKFHRIILDEAQNIKNDRTVTARAAWALQATHRWCLTGTPMMNGVHELYSLLNFLQIRPYNDKKAFSKTFRVLLKRTNEDTDPAMERLRVLLKAMLLRRMKSTKINGRPIVDLPPKTEHQIHVEFTPDEKEYYTTLEKKSQVIFNKYLRENAVGRNYSNVLVLLLRLRQACCHPHLNHEADDDNAGIDNEQSVKELDANVIQRIKTLESFECPVCYDAVTNPTFFVPCGHDGCQECLVRIIDSAVREGANESGSAAFCRCPECRTNFDPKQCFTYETFKKIHMPETLKKEEEEAKDELLEDACETEWETDTDAEKDDDVDENGNLKDFIDDDDELLDNGSKEETKPKIKGKVPVKMEKEPAADLFDDSDEDTKQGIKEQEPDRKEKKFTSDALFEDSDEDTKPSTKEKEPEQTKKKYRKKKTQRKGKGKEKVAIEHEAAGVKASMLKTLRKEATKNKAAHKRYMAYLRKTWLPSAKVTECMKLLKDIEETGEKTIIFSQWTLLLDLLEVAMYYEGMEESTYRRYDGSMSSEDRVEAARVFQNKDSRVKTILVSLRAGNAGLNLTTASRVIILDPFWNPYIEMQAVDRAYRIGQKKEVQVYRILTQETVEDRIMELQEKKKNVVEAALDETESKKIARLSTSELRYLFNGTR